MDCDFWAWRGGGGGRGVREVEADARVVQPEVCRRAYYGFAVSLSCHGVDVLRDGTLGMDGVEDAGDVEHGKRTRLENLKSKSR